MKQLLPDKSLPWAIIWEGVELMARREGCRLKAYLDYPGRVPTIGWGETENVRLGMVWTQQQADQRLCDEIAKGAMQVAAMCRVPPTEHQLAALVVCGYNIGYPALATSSMIRLHNQSKFLDAARAFSLWNKAKDASTGRLVEVDGLTARRAAEAAMYLEPDDGAPQFFMPQAVAHEPALHESPTIASGTFATATGGVTMLGSSTDWLDGIKEHMYSLVGLVNGLGIDSTKALALGLLVVGGVVLYRRYQQRQQGKA